MLVVRIEGALTDEARELFIDLAETVGNVAIVVNTHLIGKSVDGQWEPKESPGEDPATAVSPSEPAEA